MFGTTDSHYHHTVLYLDPDPATRRRTADGIESTANLDVEHVTTPSELRTALTSADEYACVVTEYRLEETDALALYEQLEETGNVSVPFILYTADGNETLASDAITSGLSGYVPRELDDSIERLLAQIRTVVDATKRITETGDDVQSPQVDPETTLQTERDRFAAFFEHSPDPVIVTRRGDPIRIVDVNPTFETVFGYDGSDVTYTTLVDEIVPEGTDPVSLADAVDPGEAMKAEVERLTTDGLTEFRLISFALGIDGDVYEYVIYNDISEQKSRERELERYRTLVETVGDAMYVLDAAGKIEMVNDAMAEQLGVSRENLVGSDPTDYMSDEDVERGREMLREIVEEDGRNWGTYEIQFEPVDGEPYPAEDNVAPMVDDDGNFVGSVGVIRDVSDRKERERRIRRLHDGTRLLMTSTRVEAVAQVASRVARDALDLGINAVYLYDETEDALVPTAVTDRTEKLLGEVTPIEREGGLAWDAYEAGEAIAHGDVRHDPNVQDSETPICSEAHIPIGDEGLFVVGSTEPNDFDEEALALAKILLANVEVAMERARREDELATRTAELERQNDRLDSFASTVSHDLRNPLTIATGHLESLESHIDGEAEKHREEIEWALNRMDDLIENVLTLARSGQRLTTTEPVSLDAVVDQAHRTVDPTLEIVRDEPLPTIEADEDRLLVLFENALRNAREHVGEDVTVTIEGTVDGFAIADDGPGISADERDAVLESGYSTDSDGTGFGLAIVSEVVDAHGWSVAVEESEAGGFRLAISLQN
ncbi:PAS domain S-box protein [Natrinema halophilum]|nr:PAS domain S-box protein [Natrinema halophilum]QLG49189.2 PAS domain S-box protein [Natrinema halophilum]